MKKTFLLLSALFMASLSHAATVSVAAPQIFNAPELSGASEGIRAAMAGRLASPGIEVYTADGSSVEWVVKTSITNIGGVFSVDAELFNAGKGQSVERAFEMADSADKIMPALAKIAEKLKIRLAEGEVSIQHREPQGRRPAPPVDGLRGGQETSGIDLAKYKLLGQLKGEALSLMDVDLDKDGQTELLALLRGGEMALVRVTPSFGEVWRQKLDLNFEAACASAGDIDRDGNIEVFVAGAKDENVYTRGFRADAAGLKAVGEPAWAFVRLGEHPAKGTILYGIPSVGGLEVLSSSLYQYGWDGSKFAKGEKIPTPDAVSPVNVEWLKASGGESVLSLTDSAGRLRIYGEKMEKLYASESPYKGGRAFFEGSKVENQLGFIPGYFEVNTPAVSYGGLIYMHDNLESIRLTKSNTYENGQLLALRWDGVTLAEVGQSPKFSGYFTALALDGKAGRIYGALVKPAGMLVKEYNTQIISF